MSKVGMGLLLSAVLVLTPMWAAAAEFKVGVVDGMDVVSKSAAGKGVQDAIKRKSDDLGKPFAQKRAALAKEVEDFHCRLRKLLHHIVNLVGQMFHF